jgi:polysaccharide biosynthesis protein PslG
MRRTLPLLLSLLLLLAVPAAAPARAIVGLGDQHAATFSDPALRSLHLRTARLALQWDWFRDPAVIASTDAWMASVRAAGLRPLISFNRNWRPSGRRVLPPVRTLVTSFRALRARYPDVRDFGVWNEANHKTQPLAHKPAMAARYYNALRADCRRCSIVAADVLDDAGMPRWIAAFGRVAHRPRLWGLHNYRDANRATGSTRRFLGIVPGTVWLTETGGIRRPVHARGRGYASAYRAALRRQAAGVRRVFATARSSHRIRRIYFYQWRHDPHSPWDSAFLEADGHRRPAYRALRAGLRG